jgi:hypothetical protein
VQLLQVGLGTLRFDWLPARQAAAVQLPRLRQGRLEGCLDCVSAVVRELPVVQPIAKMNKIIIYMKKVKILDGAVGTML